MRNAILGPHARLVPLVMLAAALVEYAASRLLRRETHALPETATSLGVAVGGRLVKLLETALVTVPFAYVYEHRLFHFDQRRPLALVALFFVTELAYYWHHRISHAVRWMWATHSVHHSPTRLNFTAAIRLGWTGNLSGNFLFYLPVVWLGFYPPAVLAMLALDLTFQFFIHTELAGRLGVLELVLNTPAHHRVHHASNAACLDKNFGGMVIVFDRLFGTFAEAPAHEPLRYGLVHATPARGPVAVALGEWRAMFGDFAHASGIRARLRTLLFIPQGGSS